jgi:DNA-directed RNA polymerase specialized sigma24 family protein
VGRHASGCPSGVGTDRSVTRSAEPRHRKGVKPEPTSLKAIPPTEVIYNRYARELTQFAAVLVGPAEAADVVSEAMLRCWRGADWEAVGDVRAYLHRAVLNQARQWARSRHRRRRREAAFGRLAAPGGSGGDDRPEVWEAVARLSVRQRAVIFLAYWEDLPPSQIAARLSISEGSVRRHLARARQQLRKVLSDERR